METSPRKKATERERERIGAKPWKPLGKGRPPNDAKVCKLDTATKARVLDTIASRGISFRRFVTEAKLNYHPAYRLIYDGAQTDQSTSTRIQKWCDKHSTKK